jgi:hypothetical protein
VPELGPLGSVRGALSNERPYRDHLRGRFKTLVEELESPEFTEELSRQFGKDLHPSTHNRA